MSQRNAGRSFEETDSPMAYVTQDKTGTELNRPYVDDLPVHEWYRFVLSYPPHLVRDYVTRFGLGPGRRVLDPYCGTGTTLVECKKLGIESVGTEPNPVVHMAAFIGFFVPVLPPRA